MTKKIICLVLSVAMLLTALPITSLAALGTIDEENYADMNQTFTPLDLTGLANMGFADDFAGDGKGGWTDQGSVNDMRNFDLRGRVKIHGVDFDIIDPEKNDGKSVITLRGQNLMTLTNTVDIPVNQKAAGVYFLHAAAYVVSNIATYTFVYADGSTHEVPIRNGKENFNFWGTGSSDTVKIAWTGSNVSTSSASLYLYCMENPYPDKVIEKLVCSTAGDTAFCMIVAATLTDKGPYLMREKDIGNPDTSNWYPYEMPTHDTIVGTPLDCSKFLDGPAGKHGYLTVDENGTLIFEDGTLANFWGADTGEAALIGHDALDVYVDRIAAMGFNLIRVHNYMASHVGAANIYASGTPKDQLDPQRVDSLCYFIAKCKEKGIYIYLDMLTARRASEDDNLKVGATGGVQGTKSMYFVDDYLQELEIRHVREILGTYNPYTGMTLGEDPVIVFIDFINEASLISESRSDGISGYIPVLHEAYAKWLKQKYGNDDNLRKAWRHLGVEGLLEGESMEDASVEFGFLGEREAFTDPRHSDNLQFAADTMSNFYFKIKAVVEEMNCKALCTQCTVWGMEFPGLMYTITDSDLTDSHTYWSHPTVNNAMQAGTTSGYNGPISVMEDKVMGIYGLLFGESIYGMPHTITEWDECDLNPTMCEAFTLMGAYTCFQDWVPLAFTVSNQLDMYIENATTDSGRVNTSTELYYGDPNAIRNYWCISNNPVKMGTLPAGSIMALRRDVTKAEKGFYTRMSQNDYFHADNRIFIKDPYIGVTGKTGHAYDKRSYDPEYNDDDILYRAYMSKKLGIPYVSYTGEMRTDLKNVVFELNTEYSQAVVGKITDKEYETDDMKVTVTNPFANINLTSLDDKPIWNADSLLITAAGDQRNTDEVRSRDGTSIVVGGTAPILVEPIIGRLTLKTKDDVTVYRLGSTGERLGTARVEKDENGYPVVCLQEDDVCMNYEVVRTKRANGARGANEHIVYEQVELKPLFDDLEGFDWAARKISRNAMLGYMGGVSETSFAPGANITRGDFISAVINSTKLTCAFESNFEDVASYDANYKNIGIAKAFGVVNGDEDGKFNPNGTISIADAKRVLQKAIDEGNVNSNAEKLFENLFGKNYDPAKVLTRAEVSCLVYDLLWE